MLPDLILTSVQNGIEYIFLFKSLLNVEQFCLNE